MVYWLLWCPCIFLLKTLSHLANAIFYVSNITHSLSYSFLGKIIYCLSFNIFDELSNIFFVFRYNKLLECILTHLDSFIHCFLGLLFANISPSTFNVRHCSIIDCMDIWLCECAKHRSWKILSIKCLWFDSIEHFFAKFKYLLNKFRSELW